jgi:hypothetical protein
MRLADLPDDETLLNEYAEKIDKDHWQLNGLSGARGSVLGAIKIALALDRRPTLIMTSDAMLALIGRVEALEAAQIDARTVVREVRWQQRRNGEG